MYIRCWGSRGSVPVSGKEYVKYGGDTTCIEIRSQSGDIIIVDSGTGIRRLGNQLISEDIYEYNLIFTHAHWDHIMGFPFFKPFYLPQSKFKMYRAPNSVFIKRMLSNMMEPPYFPVPYAISGAEIKYMNTNHFSEEFQIGSIRVTPVPLSHPNTGRGYKFTEDSKSFVFMTDNELLHQHPGGLPYESYLKFVEGADLLLHDGEYTPEEYTRFVTWGHTAYTDTLDLAINAGVKKLGLFHINQERTDKQVDEIVKDCRRIIDERGSSLECFAVARDMSFEL